MKIRPARVDEHAELVRLARTSPYTRDFSNRMMFSSDAAYERGWIRVADDDEAIVGFTCVRHKVRSPVTVLYFIVVNPEKRGGGIGTALMEDLEFQAEAHGHRWISLNVAKDNEAAIYMYEKFGYEKRGESLKGTGWRMEKLWYIPTPEGGML